MGCTPDAVVCDDTPDVPLDLGLVLVQVAVGIALLAAVLLLVAVLLRRRRAPRAPVARVWVSAAGEVVRRAP